MSAREAWREVIDALAGSYWSPDEGVADHVYKYVAAEVRAETLREAAESLKILYGEYSSPQMQGAIRDLRRMAEGEEK